MVHRTVRGRLGQSPLPVSSKQEHEMHPPSFDSGAANMSMQSSVNIADPMSRESSGTAWVPDSTPMYGRMFMFGDDMLMLHGAIFPRYTNVSTRRGDDRIDAPNWIMGMYSHPLGDSAQLGLRAMMSLDLLTEGGRGYPLLFQTGESWHDQPLHDRQHPHDLFSELSVSYSQKFTHDLSAYLYFGYPGEPALGPPAFMHRLSAMDNPDAPISHHWQDSTHIVFGVATAGLQWSRNGGIKVEGSVFTGREPDEVRYDFDRPRFDSFSGRVSWNPIANLALQVSHGYIKSPEALDPDTKVHRTTASAIYNQPLGRDTNWSTSFVWGQNNATQGRSNAIVPGRNQLPARTRHGLRALGTRGKIRARIGYRSGQRIGNLPGVRLYHWLRPRSYSRPRPRCRPRRPIHPLRSSGFARSFLRRQFRLRIRIFSAHPPFAS